MATTETASSRNGARFEVSPLGSWIRRVRANQSISQRELAQRAGLSRSYLCDIERGRGTRPSIEALDKLAAALGVSRLHLLRLSGVVESTEAADGDREIERRLLALVRDLSPEGRAAVERFARFTHRDEHQWTQPTLLDGDPSPASAERETGPTLFDLAAVPAERTVSSGDRRSDSRSGTEADR